MTTSAPISLSLGNLTRADGSAIAATGNSAVQVAVHGPGDVPLHKEQLEEATVEVVFKDAARSKDCKILVLCIRHLIECLNSDS